MSDKILNFILALVTGRVWSEVEIKSFGNKSIDIWDCEEGVKFFVQTFVLNECNNLEYFQFTYSCAKSNSIRRKDIFSKDIDK